MSNLPLLAVPNVSEGRRRATIDAIAEAFTDGGAVRLLDVHSDIDHHRSVYTLAGDPGRLPEAMLAGAKVAIERIDVGEGREPSEIGEHPHVGALDVMPISYLDPSRRGEACAVALIVAEEIGEGLGVPVFLYGDLADGRTRAYLRRGGVGALAARMEGGELLPDFGPSLPHPTAGATLVAAREPLVAFNLELAPPAGVDEASRIARLIREGGEEGLPGVRAIGVELRRHGEAGDEAGDGTSAERSGERVVGQVSMNVERPLEVPLSAVVEAVRRHAEPVCGELVGLVPRAALEGFPTDLSMPGFDATRHVIENALGF